MTEQLVRVFRIEGKIETTRVAVWSGTEWIELECEGVDVIDTSAGPLCAVLLPCHVGHDLSTPAWAKKTSARERRKGVPPPLGDQKIGNLAPDFDAERGFPRPPAPEAAPEAPASVPVSELPVWGDETKRIRWFTIVTQSGERVTNTSTDVAGSDKAAGEHVLAKWNKLAAGVKGRAGVRAELQPEGRVGSDRPDVAPPAPKPQQDDERPDLIG